MYFKQKLAYMALGCLFTIIGYIIASLSGNPVDAQSQGDKSEPTVIDEIVCRSLRVVNDDGKIGITMHTYPFGGGYMSIYHRSGKRGITMDMANAAEMSISGRTGKGAVRIYTSDDGAHMSIYHPGGERGVIIGTGDNDGYMYVVRANGKGSASIGTRSNGGFMSIHRKDQKGSIQLGGDEYGGNMAIFNKGGQNVLQAGVSDKGGGIITTQDKHGYKTGRLP